MYTERGCVFRNAGTQFRVIKGSLKFQVRNITRGTVIGESVNIADTSSKRRTGLLKHAGLGAGEGLWIVPCEAVHTFFMKFTIDVLYLDRKRRVKKAVSRLVPWRISGYLPAHSVLELPAGAIEMTQTDRGDELEFQEV